MCFSNSLSFVLMILCVRHNISGQTHIPSPNIENFLFSFSIYSLHFYYRKKTFIFVCLTLMGCVDFYLWPKFGQLYLSYFENQRESNMEQQTIVQI